VNPIAIAFAVAGLALVAGVGVMAGFLRESPPPIEPLADPLEDRREALLRSLADLEEAHASGALDGAGYLRLREQTEGRMARVLRALDRRDAAPSASVAAVALEDAPAGGGRASAAEPRRVPPWAVAVLIGGTVLAVVVASLARDAESQPRASTPQAPDDPLGFFERRVEEHPDDLAARLDLAHRYLDAGMVEDALSEYAVALELDPDDAEALAHVGIILYQNGRPEEALRSVDRALSTDPRYPEGLFIRGVILLRGLDRPEDAIAAFETYLDAAPFGVERQTAKDLIAEARVATDGT
jgi:tetratricopeptide (TPR) repeat protein